MGRLKNQIKGKQLIFAAGYGGAQYIFRVGEEGESETERYT